MQQSGRMDWVFIHDYHEDENGNALTSKQLATALTGNETAMLLPAGATQHDIDYMLADKPPIEVDKLSLSPDELKVLGIFTRDLKEMRSAAFFKEGPGTLSCVLVSPPTPKTLQTAVTDEEIRSFVTIFRRLYMEKEPANLQKAVDVFAAVVGAHPIARWIAAGAKEIATSLDRAPSFTPFAGPNGPAFTVKLLIDVFLYTQYAHQPDERRTRQFQECLQNVGNDRAILTHLFLSELWRTALEMSNVGQHIAQLFGVYCHHHKTSHGVVTSTADGHPGIGVLEKSHEREDRILREKANELAAALWRDAGEPPGGSLLFVDAALARLRDAMKENLR